MKIISLDKQGEIVFIPQSLEDLWTIKTITNKKDVICGDSYRRQRLENQDDSSRKPVYISLEIEKYDFSQELNSLRFTGKIIESRPQELAPIGDYHTIEIKLNKKYKLIKKNLFKHQIDLLKRSSSFNSEIILVVIDNDLCSIFKLTNFGVNEITKINSNKPGKMYKNNFSYKDFFEKIYDIIKNYKHIIIAGPGHVKSELNKFIKLKTNKINCIEVSLQNTDKSSINELFKKKKVSKIFENSIIFEENKLFNIFLENLGKQNNKAIYGLKEISKYIELGSIEFILISKDLWISNIEEIQNLIRKSEIVKTKVHVVDNNSEIVKSLRSFGGIVGVLRYSF